jgi:hypothetical protein
LNERLQLRAVNIAGENGVVVDNCLRQLPDGEIFCVSQIRAAQIAPRRMALLKSAPRRIAFFAFNSKTVAAIKA